MLIDTTFVSLRLCVIRSVVNPTPTSAPDVHSPHDRHRRPLGHAAHILVAGQANVALLAPRRAQRGLGDPGVLREADDREVVVEGPPRALDGIVNAA